MEIPAVVVLFRCGLRRPDGQHPIPAWMPLCGEDVNQLETPWRKDTRMWGMSPKTLGRFIIEESSHSWWWAVMVPVFTSQGGCLGQKGLVCSVSPQRTELGQTWDRLSLRMATNQSCPWGEVIQKRIIYLCWGEKGDEESVFFLSLCSTSSPEAFSVVYMEQCIHSIVDGVSVENQGPRENEANVPRYEPFIAMEMLNFVPELLLTILERTDPLIYIFNKYSFRRVNIYSIFTQVFIKHILCSNHCAQCRVKWVKQDTIVPPFMGIIFKIDR